MDKPNRRKLLESALNAQPVNPKPKEKEQTKKGVMDNQQPYSEKDIPTTSEFVALEDLY